VADAAQEYLTLLATMVKQPALRIVDKTLTSYFTAGFIHMGLPHARFVNCIRHPADNFISAYQNDLDHAECFDQGHYVSFYLGKQKLITHWKTCFPDKIFDLYYEELVKNPETVVRRLLAFLGLDWDPTCLTFFERSSTVRTFSRHQVRSSISTGSVARWRNYEKHLGPLFTALAKANFTYPEF
jgi:Sulfotransferase family